LIQSPVSASIRFSVMFADDAFELEPAGAFEQGGGD
jgi:hypothetical protein